MAQPHDIRRPSMGEHGVLPDERVVPAHHDRRRRTAVGTGARMVDPGTGVSRVRSGTGVPQSLKSAGSRWNESQGSDTGG